MKKWLIIFVIFLCGSLAWCENLQGVSYEKKFNAENNPIIYTYIKNYADQLYDAFDARKIKSVGGCADPKYILYKDGTISEPKSVFKEYPSLTYAKEILKNNLPPPFPKGMDVEQVNILIWFCKDKYDEVKFDYYPHKTGFTIGIDKNYRKRKLKK